MAAFSQEEQTDTAQVHLKGRVTDEKQEPVSMCMIRVEGQAAGTMADLEGRYKLSFHTGDSVVIPYSMVGFTTRRRVLKKWEKMISMSAISSAQAGSHTRETNPS